MHHECTARFIGDESGITMESNHKPGEQENFSNRRENEMASTVTFTVGCAINRDMYYIACSLDEWRETEEEPYTVMYIYQHQTDEKWFYHALPGWSVMSAAFLEPSPGAVRSVYALSEEGALECYSREGSLTEKITGAGLDTQGEYGSLTAIRPIENRLYVCGYGGQVYRKNRDKWVHFDEGLLQASVYDHAATLAALKNDQEATMKFIAEMADDARDLIDINGSGASDIYVVGSAGFIAHHDGFAWRILRQVTAENLNAIHIVSEWEVWIVGSNGTVLQGNAKDGFKALSRKIVETDFYDITHFNDEIYISGSNGIYLFKGGKLQRQKISDAENLGGVNCIESKDGVLWALSEKKLLRSGINNEWEVFEHPNNI
jgi:hypothetical protein